MTVNQFEIQTTPPDRTNVAWFNPTDKKLRFFINGEWAEPDDEGMSVVETSFSELKDLRGNSKLQPGQKYRITDYQCTTIQSNTQSAGHQFDIIVTALSENTLSEEASAIQHEGDTYFANNNLSAWKLWYCLDNDTDRFAWADSTNGKGVIYRLIDEWNNDCPYDFKNIQFKRKLTDGQYDPDNGIDTWVYTFNAYDIENNVYEDAWKSIGKAADDGCNCLFENIIKPYAYDYAGSESQKFRLNDIVFLNTYEDEGLIYFECHSNFFDSDCSNNTFGNYCYYNTFGNSCQSNTFSNYCSNTFGDACSYNTFGDYCSYNTFGNSCQSNTFGNHCNSNTFSNYCSNNTFGNYCSNTFGDYCYYNTFGNSCQSNTFGNSCSYIKFGDSNSVKSYYRYIIVENGNQYIYLNCTGTTSSSAYYQNVTIAQGVNNTTTYKTITDSNVGQTYKTTYQPADSQVISI